MEPGNEVEFQEYPLDEETNLDSSKHPRPMTLPSIMLPAIPAMPTLVPRRGLLVLSESGSSQLTRRQGVGLVSIITTIRDILDPANIIEHIGINLVHFVGMQAMWLVLLLLSAATSPPGRRR